MGKLLAKCRFRIAAKTDERVRLINEIISGIQVIKMYAWEKPYQKIADLVRRGEIKEIRKGNYVRGAFVALVTFPSKFSIFVAILIYILLNDTINARQAFMLAAYFNVIQPTMAISFPLAIFVLAEVAVSISRISEFLLLNLEEDSSQNQASQDPMHDNAVVMDNCSVKWKESFIFSEVTLNIKRGRLVAIVGKVGCGKSSIFQAILKEVALTSGMININGKVCYSSQQPWLFTGSVRQNILFTNPMDKLRYDTVVSTCALKTDFSILPYADKTVVGERGVSLSGGQKARVNLARAVYNNADIYLLDDPLSAVDSHVGKQLFEQCLRNFLRDKTVVLITHQLQYLKDVDYIFVIENGKVGAEGNFDELQAAGIDFTKVLEQTQVKVKKEDDWEILEKRTSVQSYTSFDDELVPGALEETKASGIVSSGVYTKYISGAKSPFLILITLLLLLGVQAVCSITDYFITFWTNLEQDRNEIAASNPNSLKENGFWNFSTDTFIIIYSSLIVLTAIMVVMRSVVFYETCLNASKMLYQKMFKCITHAKLLFFNANPSGRILNRFSTDIALVDEQLPTSVLLVFKLGLQLVSVMIMVAVVNPWLLIIAGVVVAAVYLMARFYLKTSRDVKRIEGIARSPVYSHINATLQGLSTIRAFNAAGSLEKEFHKHQDLHSSAWYSFISSSTAFGYWLDLIIFCYIGIVTFSFIVLGNEHYGGNIGLAISQVMILSGLFQVTMKEMAEVENMMTSVERITEYTTIDGEPTCETDPNQRPLDVWPEYGRIEFQNVSLAYTSEDPPVLKNLSFIIEPLQKIGIVGRTGAGKSSIIAALFRLTEIEGSVVIDQIDTKHIGLHHLRCRISIIPQEAVLFSGTVRRNLDPFNEYSDEDLWKALDEVELKDVIKNLSGGLEAEIQEGGTNLSVGQRQLVCLARAILRNNKILVLDEATANVDPQTDSLIQKTIRNKFSDCTVLTIAHRLNTIMDSDKILVMNSGEIAEFDHPHILLQNENGYLYSMVQQNSKGMREMLTKIAKDNYYKHTKNEAPENFT